MAPLIKQPYQRSDVQTRMEAEAKDEKKRKKMIPSEEERSE